MAPQQGREDTVSKKVPEWEECRERCRSESAEKDNAENTKISGVKKSIVETDQLCPGIQDITDAIDGLSLKPALLERGARKKTPPSSERPDIYKLKTNSPIDRKGRNATKDILPTTALQIPGTGTTPPYHTYVPLLEISPTPRQTYLQKSGGGVWVSDPIISPIGQNSGSWLDYRPPSSTSSDSSSPYHVDAMGFSPRDSSPSLRSPSVLSALSDHESQGGSPGLQGMTNLLSLDATNEIGSPAGTGMSPSNISESSCLYNSTLPSPDDLSLEDTGSDLENLPVFLNTTQENLAQTTPPASPSGLPPELVGFILDRQLECPERVDSPGTICNQLTKTMEPGTSPEMTEDIPMSVQEINNRTSLNCPMQPINLVVVPVPISHTEVNGKCPTLSPPRVYRPIKPKPPVDTLRQSIFPAILPDAGSLVTKKRNSHHPAKTSLENMLSKKAMDSHLKKLLLKFRQREDQLLMPLNTGETIMQAAIGIKNLNLAFVSCNLASQWASNKGQKERFLQFINHRDVNGRTALFYAAAYNFPEFVAYLLEAGADPNLSDKNSGNTPLHQASQCGKEYLETTKALCDCSDTNMNAQNNAGLTPLHQAVLKHNREFADESGAVRRIINNLPNIEHLLRNKAQTNIQDNRGKTVYHSAVDEEKLDLLKVLNRLWFHPDAIGAINLQDENGRTPLHTIVEMQTLTQQRKKEIIEELISNGASAEMLDNFGNRPVDILPPEETEFTEEIKGLLQCQWSFCGWTRFQ